MSGRLWLACAMGVTALVAYAGLWWAFGWRPLALALIAHVLDLGAIMLLPRGVSGDAD